MKALNEFIAQQNKWASMFNGKGFSLDTHEDRQDLANEIDCQLSPECLTCDGELSRAQVQAKLKKLTKVAAELKALDPSVTFYEYA